VSSVEEKVTAALLGKKIREAKGTVFRVPNDPGGDGKAFIRACKQYLNKDDYRLRVRFRGPRKGQPNHTVKSNARSFSIYLDKK